jgi:hypothetical protein
LAAFEAMPPKKRKARLRTFLTNAQKRQLQQFWSEHPGLQLLAVADWARERFGVSVGRATLYRIYHAPPEAFAGNAQQKKRRRVKYPALERDIVAFCERSRRLNEGDGGLALSDDALLRAAAELRAHHGISEAELKLSNGWLHRFKERHALRAVPQAAGEQSKVEDAEATGTDAAAVATESRELATGKRKPRAPPRRKTAPTEDTVAADLHVGDGDDGGNVRRIDESAAASISSIASNAGELAPSDTSTSVFEDTADFTTPSAPVAAQPLTYLSASAADSVTAVGFVRWKLKSGMAHAEHFSVDNDGVSILRSAKYQLNVELQHTAPPVGSLSAIFKVWAGVELLGQCEHPIQSQGGRALSVLQLECKLSSQAVVRVEYHGAGVVCKDSRLVLRLLSEFT